MTGGKRWDVHNFIDGCSVLPKLLLSSEYSENIYGPHWSATELHLKPIFHLLLWHVQLFLIVMVTWRILWSETWSPFGLNASIKMSSSQLDVSIKQRLIWAPTTSNPLSAVKIWHSKGIDARLQGFVSNLYSQVIFPGLRYRNHIHSSSVCIHLMSNAVHGVSLN